MLAQRRLAALHAPFFHHFPFLVEHAIVDNTISQIQTNASFRLGNFHLLILFANLLHGWSPFAPRVRSGKLSSSARPAVSSHLKPGIAVSFTARLNPCPSRGNRAPPRLYSHQG